MPVACVPLTVEIDRRAAFDEWLSRTLEAARR
jgi:hypothetical protein